MHKQMDQAITLTEICPPRSVSVTEIWTKPLRGGRLRVLDFGR